MIYIGVTAFAFVSLDTHRIFAVFLDSVLGGLANSAILASNILMTLSPLHPITGLAALIVTPQPEAFVATPHVWFVLLPILCGLISLIAHRRSEPYRRRWLYWAMALFGIVVLRYFILNLGLGLRPLNVISAAVPLLCSIWCLLVSRAILSRRATQKNDVAEEDVSRPTSMFGPNSALVLLFFCAPMLASAYNAVSLGIKAQEIIGRDSVEAPKHREGAVRTSDDQTIPNGSCAIIVASRNTISEVQAFIVDAKQPITTVYQSQNGWYALSVGHVKIEMRKAVVENLVDSGNIPVDSFCSTGRSFLKSWTAAEFPR